MGRYPADGDRRQVRGGRKEIVASWIENSVLIEGTHTNAQKNKVDCVTLNTTKAEAIMAEVNVMNGPPE